MTKIAFFLLLCMLPLANMALSPSTPTEYYLEQFHLDAAQSEAESIADPISKDFYLLHIQLYKFISTQNQDYLEGFDDSWSKTVKALEKSPDSLALQAVMLAELYGKKAMIEFLQENYFASLRMVRQCHKWTKKGADKHPSNKAIKKFQGLFNVVFASVPKKFQGFAAMLGYKGDAEIGMQQLEQAAKSSEMLRAEAQFIAFFVEKNVLGKAEKAMRRMEKQQARKGSSMVTDFLLASAYCGMHLNDKALNVLQKRDQYAQDKRVFFTPYWDHVLAKCFYFKADYDQARLYFRRFLVAHKGKIYELDATFRLGMSLILSGDTYSGQQIFSRISEMETSPFDEDEYALAMAQKFAEQAPSAYLKQLFKARNYFDGGYHQQALMTLDRLKKQAEALSPAEQTELYYRYGRIYHSIGKLEKQVAAIKNA